MKAIAEILGYDVIFRRIKGMQKDEIGMTCPDLNKIYIDPKVPEDAASTLAHEIGHILLLAARPPGHNDETDTDFDLRVAENAADKIGEAICKALGHSPDFLGIGEKGLLRIAEAAKVFGNSDQFRAFAKGYSLALADALPSSEIGLSRLLNAFTELEKTEPETTKSRFSHPRALRAKTRR
jgi:hypothetical protein